MELGLTREARDDCRYVQVIAVVVIINDVIVVCVEFAIDEAQNVLIGVHKRRNIMWGGGVSAAIQIQHVGGN